MHPASEWRVHPASHLWGCIRTIKLNTDNVHKYVDSTVWPAPYGNLAAPYQNRLIFGIHMHSGDGGGILLLDCTLDIMNRNSCYVYKSSTATRFTWDPCKIVHSVQYDAICTINGPTRNIVKCRDVYNVQFFSKNAWRNLCKLSILSTAQSCIVSGPTGNGHPMHRSFMSLFSLDPPIWDPLGNSDDDKSLLSIICHAQKEEGGERWSGFMREAYIRTKFFSLKWITFEGEENYWFDLWIWIQIWFYASESGDGEAQTCFLYLLNCEYEFWLGFMPQRVLYCWRWWGTDMAIAHYCPKPVWPLSRPGFTVITPKVQKPTLCLDTFQHLDQVG